MSEAGESPFNQASRQRFSGISWFFSELRPDTFVASAFALFFSLVFTAKATPREPSLHPHTQNQNSSMSIHPVPSFPVLSLSLAFLFALILTLGWSCDPRDQAALLDISNALNVPVWPRVNGSVTDCCRWFGITCSNQSSVNESSPPNPSQRVVSLIIKNIKLGGQLPNSLGGVSYLQTLKLQNVTLRGSLPRSLGRLTYLRILQLPANNFSSTIPEELYQLQSLEILNLFANSFSGHLSPAIGNLTSLRILVLSNNQLSGKIPDVFHGLKHLQSIALSDNLFSGPVPVSLSSCSSLRVLDVARNSLSGTLHINFTALSGLEVLTLQNNNFSGCSLKPVLACKALQMLDFGGFEIDGNIDWELLPTSLWFVKLESNNFSNITQALLSFQRFPDLAILDIRGNFGNETMPAVGITGFPNLVQLSIRNAKLFGTLPVWLSRLDKLLMLDLSENYLTGEIPIFMSQLKNLNNSDNIDDKFVSKRTIGSITIEIWTTASLDLSRNMFSGDTWMHLTNLVGLNGLDLSHNSLSGSIPNDISRMKRLQFLSLASNNISGTIPSSMKELTSLSYFCVSNNMLTGDVPIGNQFSSFQSECFDGNPGLCYFGKPGCYSPPVVASKTDEGNQERDTIIDMGFAFAVGVVVGYMITFLVGVTHYFWTVRKKMLKCRRSH